MTVSTSINSVVYRGNGAATQFAVPFKVLDEDHLVVRRRVFATGTIDYTYIGTDYSYAGVGASSGTLTLGGAALDDDYELVIERIVPYTQDLDIVNAGGFYPETVENQLDLMTMEVQQLADLAGRGVTVPVGEDGLELTSVVDRAGKFFSFNGVGEFVASAGTGSDPDLRTDLAVPATGASLVGYDPASAPDTTIEVALDALHGGILYSSLFPSLTAALQAWMLAGGTLVINQDYEVTTQFTTLEGALIAGKSYHLTSDGPRTITYNGANALNIIEFYADGATPFKISGDLTFDCNNLCATPIWVRFDEVIGSERRNCEISGVKTRNSKLHSVISYGANGIRITGGFDFLHVHDCHIDGVSRIAGLTSGGTVMSNKGISINGSNTTQANPKRTLVERCSIKNVTSEDTPGGANYGNMDGLLMFIFRVSGDDVAIPTVRDCEFVNCTGRAIKRYCTGATVNDTLRGGLIENIIVRRSVRGETTGSNDIACQDGTGIVRNIIFYYSGDAHLTDITVPLGASVNPPAGWTSFNNGGVVWENITIRDSTGVTLNKIIGIQQAFDDTHKRFYRIKGLYHQGTAKALFSLGKSGTAIDCIIELQDIDVNLTTGVAQDDDAHNYLKVKATGFHNRGSDVPAMMMVAGTPRLTLWGDWIGDATLKGVKPYVPVWRGNPAFTNGFRGPGIGVLSAPAYGTSETFGRTELPRRTLANGAIDTLPPYGSHQNLGGDFNFAFRLLDVADATEIRINTLPGGTTLTNVTAIAFPAIFDVRSTGADSGNPASGNIEIWKDGATQGIKISNYSGVSIAYEVVFNP